MVTRRVQAGDAARAAIDHGPLSARATSRALGHAEAWARLTAAPGKDPGLGPRLGTVADIADVQGLDVCLVDRSSGEVVAVVDPPHLSRASTD